MEKNKVIQVEAPVASGFSQKVQDFKLLVKFRLNLTVVFSALMAYAIGAPNSLDWRSMLLLGLGGFLITGAANALNQVIEKDYDRLMVRTADRPIAAGRMKSSDGVMIAGIMAVVGIMALGFFNPWASFFGSLALVSYAFIYTPLKRHSTVAIPVGAVPGALPMLIGCVAAEGDLTVLALLLFTLQFFWQFPHFWAIGWLGFDEYKKAGYRLMLEKDGGRDARTGLYSGIYALLLVPVVWGFWYIGVTGWIAPMLSTILSLGYSYMGFNLYAKNERKAARSLMFYSFFYLPLTLVLLFIDKL